MSRISKIQIFALVLAAVVVGACTLQGPAGPTININNINTNTITLAPITGSGESKVAGCPDIARLQINYPTLLTLGTSAPFSVTPKDANGKDRTAACDEADGVSITAIPADLVSFEDPASFTTSVKGLKAGDTSVSVAVNKARSTVRITVK